MPDTPTTPTVAATPPQPPVVVKNTPDLSTAFITSLNRALESEKAGTVPPAKAAPASGPEESKFGGNLGHVVKTLIKDAEKAAAAAPAAPVGPPATVVTPTVTPTVAATPPVVVAPATPPITVQKVPEIEKFKLPDIPQPEPSKVVSSTLSPLPLDLNGLDEDERYEVETAQFAEQRHPDRYRGHAQKVLDYIRQHRKVVSDLENSGETDIEDNPRYKGFVKSNKPQISTAEKRKLEYERIAYQAAQEAKTEAAKEFEDLRKQLAATRAAPIIERSLNEFRTVVETILPREDDPLLSQIPQAFAATAVQAADQFIRLSNKQIAYDPTNNLHKGIADFIEDQAAAFIKSGDANLKRGNQTFVSRATFNTMPETQRGKHFTFTDDDVLRILAVNAQMNANQAVARERKRLEDAGYSRKATGAAPVVPLTPAQVVPDPSPRSSVGVTPTTPTETTAAKDPFRDFLLGRA